ncbi:hypothetical protein EDM53_05570 [Rickettsiales endosymbiont of Peranema trichophorum]|uniref:hypothetical protein n=1 Tax=Rickettsiales endosymbiont of Peranema trichophorum TaxID=2486577 RepID=UPI001023D78A|nr:hypothetical protein [Rickettsiales endosymbiont of Peranema trichophorum]RZI45249.1 hypothetical protein EDM53_05570 [Rickettsiales endosymbiont of Peranema trichophorum]
MRYKIAVILMIMWSGCAFALDIPSFNVGEQAMISVLRSSIDATPSLQGYKINLGAGTTGVAAFKKHVAGEFNVLLMWQWIGAMKDLAPGTIVVMPEHAIDERFTAIASKVKLIAISGVLHTRTLANIQNEESSAIDSSVEMIVMLGGDTQQEDGQWKLYDCYMARQLLSKLHPDKRILILNGPRTGRHVMKNGLVTIDTQAHNTAVDYVTQCVMEDARGKSWKVVDFNFGIRNLWGQALKFCLEHSTIPLILPGESTSMISESITLGIIPIVYLHDGITPTSLKYIEMLREQGKIILISSWSGRGIYRQKPQSPQQNKVVEELEKLLVPKTT